MNSLSVFLIYIKVSNETSWLQAGTVLRTGIVSIPLRPDTFERLLRAGILLVLNTALGLNQAHQVVELAFPLMSQIGESCTCPSRAGASCTRGPYWRTWCSASRRTSRRTIYRSGMPTAIWGCRDFSGRLHCACVGSIDRNGCRYDGTRWSDCWRRWCHCLPILLNVEASAPVISSEAG